MKRNTRIISLLLASALLLSLAACGKAPTAPVPTPTPSAAAGQYTDGVFEGVGIGMGGDVPVTVTVENGKITGVVVGDNSETEGVSTPAMEQIPTAIVEKQTAEVDTVAGATVTSKAIMEAVKNALSGEGPKEVAEMPFEQADIIVAGGGLAGLSAAVRAAELGAKVILIEQTSKLGGSAAVAGGYTVGVNTKTEAENQVEDSVELMMADFDRIGGEGNFLPEVALKFAENCGRSVDWLDDMGLDFTLSYGVYQPLNVTRVHQPVLDEGSWVGGYKITDILTIELDRHIESGSVYLLTNTTVTELIYEGQVVTGVVAEQKDGTQLKLTAPSTILATGGFANNEEMLKKYVFENVISNAPASSNGSGFPLLDQVGAAYMNMDHTHSYGGYLPVSGFVNGNVILNWAFMQPIWVDGSGARIQDEPSAHTAAVSNMYSEAEHNFVYYIFPESLKDSVDAPLFEDAVIPDAWAKLDELALAGNCVFKSDNIEELARMAEVDPAGLKATVEQYNADVAVGKDSVFGRTADMVSMEGTLYAVRTSANAVFTGGGPVTNDKAQIIREDGSVVEGAYVVGELAGFANYSGRANIGGICLGGALTWGMLAAEDAVSKITK